MKQRQLKLFSITACFCIPLAILFSAGAVASNSVGITEFSRGAAAAQLAEQPARLLGKNAEIFLRDVVQTGPSSFAILSFIDAAKVTVRPNSALTVKRYLEDQAELGLHRGGIRGASGAIAKLLPGQFKIKTPVATVEIHNAKFDVRYCDNDCVDEELDLEPVEKPELDSVVGRVATIRGKASATNPDGDTRKLSLGAPLHERDRITTSEDSYALLVFRDSSKITLEANTEFHIEAQKYFKNSPEKNEVIYRFMRGGMRTLTGGVGKQSPEKFQVLTPVATTGIRGTGFDLSCRGACTSRKIQGSPEFIAAAIPDGMYSYVWQGQIHHQNDAGEFDLPINQAGYIANAQSPLIFLPSKPSFMDRNPAPRPDQAEADFGHWFRTFAMDGVPPGLYLHVREGHVRITTDDGKVLDLGSGETGFAGNSGAEATRLLRLDAPRAFIVRDPTPKPESPDTSQEMRITIDDEYRIREETIGCSCPTCWNPGGSRSDETQDARASGESCFSLPAQEPTSYPCSSGELGDAQVNIQRQGPVFAPIPCR